MIVVTEENTSKTCTKCGEISDKYEKRIKIWK
jgi:transposase